MGIPINLGTGFFKLVYKYPLNTIIQTMSYLHLYFIKSIIHHKNKYIILIVIYE